jgi:uncharacterized protein
MRGFRRARFALLPPFLAALFAFLAIPASAERIQDIPQPTDYVSDFAHVLSPEAVARLDALCAQLDHSQAKAQLAVVTVHDLDGNDAAAYATELEDHWKMGNKQQNRYAMVLLAVSDRKYRIEVGYGLEGILPDAKTGDIGRSMVPDLRAGNYDGAVTQAAVQVAQVIAADANVDLGQDAQIAPVRPARHHPLSGLILLIVILVFFGGFSLLRMLFGWGLFFGGWGGGGWRGGGPWGGGGGFGGGGGDSGFGGFGGDGGGFGGGGAGGSW